jgi:hypothetical protein
MGKNKCGKSHFYIIRQDRICQEQENIVVGEGLMHTHLQTTRNNHTGLTKVVLKYGLYIDIWAVGVTEPYIYVRGMRKAC